MLLWDIACDSREKTGNVKSQLSELNGVVPKGSKIDLLAFIIIINGLEETCKEIPNTNENMVVVYMDDSTFSEILNTSSHISGKLINL